MNDNLWREVIIIGGGPAGMTTALQLKRYGLDPLLIEAERLGGLLWNANLVENYPGFPGGIPGPQLVKKMIQQVDTLGLELCFERVTSLDVDADQFLVKTPGSIYFARIVVIATGTKPKPLPAPMVAEIPEGRLFYEVYPLLDRKARRIAIIGAGDAAFDYALNLCRHNQVTIFNRNDVLKCLPLLWERASREVNITYYPRTIIEKITPASQQELLLFGHRDEKPFEFNTEILLCALGREPRLEFLTPKVQLSSQELLEAKKLFFIGDVHRGIYRQTGIAVGDGLLTAMQIYQTLKERRP